MNEDPLRYEQLIEHALRGVVRKALTIAAEQGLPGTHHFHITFRTDHPGVEMPPDLKAQYPEEMTIVLQHMFWDLAVDPDRFGVTLAFNSVHRRLVVPFEAVLIFQDQSVGFVLQFQEHDEGGDESDEDVASAPEPAPAGLTRGSERSASGSAAEGREQDDEQEDNVVPLDSFRKT